MKDFVAQQQSSILQTQGPSQNFFLWIYYNCNFSISFLAIYGQQLIQISDKLRKKLKMCLLQASPVSTVMISNVCVIYHMKFCILQFWLQKIQNPTFIEIIYSGRMNLNRYDYVTYILWKGQTIWFIWLHCHTIVQ